MHSSAAMTTAADNNFPDTAIEVESSNTQRPRKIIHVDADCFFAAIEMRDDPNLRNRPMAVGGDPSRRGVISTCNYEAR